MDIAHYQSGNPTVARRVIEQALISDREAEGKPPARLKFWLEYSKSNQKALIAEAVAAERERCAKVCEKDAPKGNYGILGNVGDALNRAAAAIREGGE